MELRNQVSQSGVHVDVDAPKGQDLAQIMAEIRAKYEKMAQKNQEELKTWHESQVDDRPSPSPIQKDRMIWTCALMCRFSRSQKCRPRSHRAQRP